MKSTKFVILSLTALMLSSCQIYKKYDFAENTKGSAIAAEYSNAVEAAPDSTSLPYLSWQQIFTDPILQGYINRALESNKNLDNARLNIEAARAALKGAKLSYFPSLAITPNGGSASYGGSHMKWSYSIPAALNWEIDAFGKILNRKRGAQIGVEQAEAYRQAVRSQIICGVANVYYSIVLLEQQLDLSRRTADIWEDQVETMSLMKNAGRTNEAAVSQSKSQYYSILASIPDLENSLQQAQNSLCLLMNTFAGQTFPVSSNMEFNLPVEFANGVPMTYLASRPDVYASERALAAAYYTTNSARAAFYPSLNISAQGGFTNLLGSIISNPGKWFIQLAGQLTAPIFSRGQNIATLEAAKAQQQIALNNFEYSVLSASADVSDALTAIRTNSEKKVQLDKQVENLEKAVEYTQDLFAYNQTTTYLEVLTAQSSLLNSQMASLACWHSRVAALISLYQAVGGGR